MKLFFLLIAAVSFIQGQISPEQMEPGKRNGHYRAWVYFKDKAGSAQANISERARQRRSKNNIQSDNLWLDLRIPNDYIETLKELNIIIRRQSRWLNAVSIETDINTLNTILKFDFIKKVEPVYNFVKGSTIGPVNENGTNQIPNNNQRDFDYGNSFTQIEQINSHTAHEAGYFGQGVRILFLDTGYMLSHVAFDSINLIAQYDFINNDDNTANEDEDNDNYQQDHHGTGMLSIIAGYYPGHLIGPAFQSEYLLAKTEDVSSETQVEEDNYVAALEWGEGLGADVTSSSLGYLDWYSYCDMDGNTAVTTIAVDVASSLGMLCVTSAGNWASTPPENPCQPPITHYISAPADADSVIAVGAVNSSGIIGSFSSRGPTYDGRIKPEVCAMGIGVVGASPGTQNDFITVYSGTSASSPLISGAAALIMSANPSWTAMQVREAMMMTASQHENPDNTYGYGIVDIMAAINYGQTAGVKPGQGNPADFQISTAYPNPFNPSVSVDITAAVGGHLIVEVLDINGRMISTLYNENVIYSTHKLNWIADGVPAGLYFIRSTLNGRFHIQKATLLK